MEERRLNVRYIEMGEPHDPYPTALSNGFVTKKDHPIDGLFSEVQSKYPLIGYGVDMGAKYGFEKIWVVFRGMQPMKDVYTMSFLPEAVKEHADYFAHYNLDRTLLFALDYRSKTMNVYFLAESPEQFPVDTIAQMVNDLGFCVPSEELLGYCTKAIPIYYTFTWDSSRVERLCFGILAPTPGDVPTHLDPIIERYTAHAPVLTEERTFIFGITFARKGDYIKIENDYNGLMAVLLQKGREGAFS
jgi:hypothetical protein